METTALEHNLADMPLNMKKFTGCLLALDRQIQVSTKLGEKSVMEFKDIYELTKRDGIVYSEKILPLAKQTIANLSNYFENYEVLDFDEWKDSLEDIVGDVKRYRVMCEILVEQYQALMGPIKARKEKASATFKGMIELENEYHQKIKELERKARDEKEAAGTSRLIGTIFGIFTFGVGSLVGGAVAAGHDAAAERNLVDAHTKEENAVILKKSMQACQDIMIPALGSFLDGLAACAGFFQTTEFELRKMQATGEEADDNKKKLYYKKMSKAANGINTSCKRFAFMLPDIVTDLKAIRPSPSDKNYVDEWEARQLKKIKEEYGESFADRFYRQLQKIGH